METWEIIAWAAGSGFAAALFELVLVVRLLGWWEHRQSESK